MLNLSGSVAVPASKPAVVAEAASFAYVIVTHLFFLFLNQLIFGTLQISLLIPPTVIRQAQSVAALLLRQALAMMTWLRQAPAKVSLRCLAPPTVTLLQSALAMLRPLCLAFTSPLCQSRNRRSHRAPSPKGHLHLSAREATEARS
jgi:hypothetical protein